MNIILLGPPGAGKGTQARFICDAFKLQQISTGDMLRSAVQAGTSLGLAAKALMDTGKLVPDQLIVDLVKERIFNSVCYTGFLFDGFPRTIPQAEALQAAGIAIKQVIELAIADEEIIRRLSGRWVHPRSGRSYHLLYHPPKVTGKDDITGEALMQRPDDNGQTVRDRLKVYHQQTEPLIAFYSQPLQQTVTQYSRINGCGAVSEIKQRIFTVIHP